MDKKRWMDLKSKRDFKHNVARKEKRERIRKHQPSVKGLTILNTPLTELK